MDEVGKWRGVDALAEIKRRVDEVVVGQTGKLPYALREEGGVVVVEDADGREIMTMGKDVYDEIVQKLEAQDVVAREETVRINYDARDVTLQVGGLSSDIVDLLAPGANTFGPGQGAHYAKVGNRKQRRAAKAWARRKP